MFCDRIREFACNQLEEGVIRRGEILLQPSWSADYSELVREYVATLEGPSTPAMDEVRATENHHQENDSLLLVDRPSSDQSRAFSPLRERAT